MTHYLTLKDPLRLDLGVGPIRDLGLDTHVDAPDDEAHDLVIGVASGQVAYPESARLLGAWT